MVQQVFESEAILQLGQVLLVERFHHNGGDDGEIIGDLDHVDADDDDGDGDDGVFDMNACSDPFGVCFFCKLKKIIVNSFYTYLNFIDFFIVVIRYLYNSITY